MPSHDVKQGDTLIGLAAKNGFPDADTLLNDPQNATLKENRKDPGVLLPGDKVFIPSRELRQEPAATDARHTFKVTRPKAWIRLAVKDADGVALANKKYQLTVEGKITSGTVPEGGIIEQQVPVDARSGQLTVYLSDTPNDVEIWELQLGYMDPLDSITGVQARLNNLGFDCGDPTGVVDEPTTRAIKAFQARIGIEQTGAIDDTLKEKLTSYYDLTQDESTLDAQPAAEESAS